MKWLMAFLGSTIIIMMLFALFGWVYLIADAIRDIRYIQAILLFSIPIWFVMFGGLAQEFSKKEEPNE